MAVVLDPLVLALVIGPMLALFVAAIFLPGFIRAVIAFAAGSALLACLFAVMGAFFAAVLELTVGAGLTAVLFLVAITLTQGQEEMPVKEGSAPSVSAAQGPEEVRPKREAAP